MATPPMPPQLSIYFARDAAKAVILRRSPSKWTRMILWHVDTDEFEMGQWLKSEIKSADLSPNGNVFVYTARKRKMPKRTEWTVLSKPPYFTGFALLSPETEHAGEVMFQDDTHILYTGVLNPVATEDSGTLPEIFKVEPYIPDVLNPNTYLNILAFSKLRKQGWQLETSMSVDNNAWDEFWNSKALIIWQKITPDGTLTRQASANSRQIIEQVRFAYQGRETTLTGYNWVDFDQRGRLIATRKGQLLILDRDDPNHKFTMLADFTDQVPEAIVPPDWVKRW